MNVTRSTFRAASLPDTEESNLDLAHKTEEIHKILKYPSNNATFESWKLHQHLT